MLAVDIEWSSLFKVANDLQATDRQVKLALNRALHRTEATMRRMSSKGLRQVLQLRAVAALRKRLKSIKLRKSAYGKAGDEAGLWYGLNDLPVSSFKGRPRKTASGATVNGTDFPGAFIGRSKVKGKVTIFKRIGKKRLHIEEQLLPIEDKAIVFLEDEVFGEIEDIFWQHFKRDLRARVAFHLGES